MRGRKKDNWTMLMLTLMGVAFALLFFVSSWGRMGHMGGSNGGAMPAFESVLEERLRWQ